MISLILFSVAVVAYTISQAIMHGRIRDDSDGKYASPKRPAIGLYYRIFGIIYRERFPLSATFLVSFTDKYHAFQLGLKLFLCASIVTYSPILGYWDAGLYFIVFGIVFTITYRIVS